MQHRLLCRTFTLLLLVLFTHGLSQIALPPDVLSSGTPGIAASTTWQDPSGIFHTYYLWKYNSADNKTVPLNFCQSIAPADVRALIGSGTDVYLATITSEAERVAVRNMVKAQKAPFVFARAEAFWIDNVFDFKGKTWQSLRGECAGVIPWGDGCKGLDKEPGNPVEDYCTTFDLRDNLLCVPTDKCSGPADKNKIADPTRKCFYDGVFNNVPCTASTFGCIFESQPFPVPVSQLGCALGPKCAAGATNLIRNGDFEFGQYTDAASGFDTFSAGSSNIFGWTVTAGSVDSVFAWQSPSGKRSIDLSGTVPGTIQQTIFLDKVARSYSLNFNLAGNPGCVLPTTCVGTGTRVTEVTIYTSGKQVITTKQFTFNAVGKTPSNMGFAAQKLDFATVPGDGQYIVQFKSITPTGVGQATGPVIDGVTLCAGAVVPIDNPCSGTSANNLIANAGFEVGTFNSNSPVSSQYERLVVGATNISPWSITIGQVDWISNTYFQNHGNSGKSISLTGPDANKGSHTTIQQTFTGPDSQSRIYTLKFFMSGDKLGNPVKAATVNIIGDKQIIATQRFTFASTKVTGDQKTANIWEEKTFQFTSVDKLASFTVQIIDATANGAYGPAFDDFSLCAGPVAGVAPSVCASGDNVINNGNFELGVAVLNYNGEGQNVVAEGAGQYDVVPVGSANINNWQIIGAPVIYNSRAWINVGSGTKSVHLSPAAGGKPASSIRQAFTIPAEKRIYSITFYMSGNPWKGSSAPKSVRVTVLTGIGHLVASQDYSFDNSKITATNMGWEKKEMAFTSFASSTSYTVTFTDLSAAPGGSVIDNIVFCSGVLAPAEDVCDGRKQYVQNSGFEAIPGKHSGAVFDTLAIGSPNLSPWQITAGTVDHIYTYWQNDLSSLYSLDLTGSPGAATIRQPVKIENVAGVYTVYFSTSGNSAGPPLVKSVTVSVLKTDNTKVASQTYTFDTAGKSNTNMGWVRQALSFKSVAGIADYILEFRSLDEGAFGTALDNVYMCATGLSAVPVEPLRCAANSLSNLVKNGGFERNSLKVTNQSFDILTPGTTALDNWALISGSVDVKYTYWAQIEGKASLDMAGSPGAGIIRQDLTLPATSTQYDLTWQMAANAGGQAVKTMDVTIYTSALKVVKTQRYTFNSTGRTATAPGWALTKLTFTTVQGQTDYIVEFAGRDAGTAGMALDDIVLCGSAAPPTTTQGELTITADNTFELYVDGVEIPPADAAQLAAACVNQPKLALSKYCCAQSVTGGSPRCAWGESETIKINLKDSSIIAVHVTNLLGNHEDPFTVGGNPGGLLVQYKTGGRVCSVSSSEWRCSHAVSDADVKSGAWATYNFNDSSFKSCDSLGTNKAKGWVGTPGAARFGGDSIWYASLGAPIKDIVPYAQWVWGENTQSEAEMWCRLYVPTLYC
eukprot:TRINITY_DN5755_c0_g1_i2.p1 TRINITY_DN5755_c0_g1~~TRINITY_DN5755_c0_g1_i2.p1  ORF type:complete len:1415 (-),score=388.58 TRINITY_DN5755_c0_g1_i2:79-4323(-)